MVERVKKLAKYLAMSKESRNFAEQNKKQE